MGPRANMTDVIMDRGFWAWTCWGRMPHEDDRDLQVKEQHMEYGQQASHSWWEALPASEGAPLPTLSLHTCPPHCGTTRFYRFKQPQDPNTDAPFSLCPKQLSNIKSLAFKVQSPSLKPSSLSRTLSWRGEGDAILVPGTPTGAQGLTQQLLLTVDNVLPNICSWWKGSFLIHKYKKLYFFPQKALIIYMFKILWLHLSFW